MPPVPAGAPDVALRFDEGLETGPFPVAGPDTTAGELRARIPGRRYTSAAHVAVCDDRGRLMGVVRAEDLWAVLEDTPLRSIMDPAPPTIVHGDRVGDVDEEVAAWTAVRHGESALAVVDGDGRFAGFIPPRRIVEVLLTAHDDDLARLGGYQASTRSARHATEERLAARLGHRLPWLLVGLAGAVAAAGIVSAFEASLERHVLIGAFVPGIVYMADAVGTQTEALVIRGLSVGVSMRRILLGELLTGLLVGVALGGAFALVGVVLWGEGAVVAAIAISLFAACSTATVVAMALPWLLQRIGWDPAFGSGPLATVVQDLLSLVIYFAVSDAMIG